MLTRSGSFVIQDTLMGECILSLIYLYIYSIYLCTDAFVIQDYWCLNVYIDGSSDASITDGLCYLPMLLNFSTDLFYTGMGWWLGFGLYTTQWYAHLHNVWVTHCLIGQTSFMMLSICTITWVIHGCTNLL